LFSSLLAYSAEAHEALSFYIRKYGGDFSAIKEVYIPNDVKHYFDRPFLLVPDVYAALRLRPSSLGPKRLPARASTLKGHYLVENLNDIWNVKTRYLDSEKFVRIAEVELHCANTCLKPIFPEEVDRNLYVSRTTIEAYVIAPSLTQKHDLLRPLFKGAKIAKKYVRTDELKLWLLKEFKVEARYPH
jgi:hypothetical protein